MNFKNQIQLLVVHSPTSFQSVLDEMSGFTEVLTDFEKTEKIFFALAFVTKQNEVDEWASKFASKLEEDGLIWFAYPKGTSKRYTCDFNRDTGWAKLGELGFEGVRQISIDEDWSALRFRKVDYIKTLNRDERRALSTEGKKRTQKEK